MLVAIDAGHGKNTAGKQSPDGSFLEYEFNRAIALRIKKNLERCGVSVLLTAPGDADVALTTRCRAANKAKADIFVSIHSNATGDTWSPVRGWEIYISQIGGEAEKLAQEIHSASIPFLGLKDRGMKTANFYVLRKTNMPAVLIEHGFYTNQDEVLLLKGTAFRDKIAIADAKGILSFLGVAWKDDSSGDSAGRNSAYSLVNGMHIMKVPVKDFRIQYWDKPKRTTAIKNYYNCGYFANYSESGNNFTLPIGNIACEIYEENVLPIPLNYLKERGEIEGNMLKINAKSNGAQFKGKKVSTFFVYQNGMAQIEPTDFVPFDAVYAVSGAPVMRRGEDVSWVKEVLPEGWDESIALPTWHGFLGLKGDGYIYYIAMQTTTDNLFISSEAFNKLQPLGFFDVIKVDGGGSFIFDLDGENKAVTDENRRINNVGRCL